MGEKQDGIRAKRTMTGEEERGDLPRRPNIGTASIPRRQRSSLQPHENPEIPFAHPRVAVSCARDRSAHFGDVARACVAAGR
jgi:hypothetical protein